MGSRERQIAADCGRSRCSESIINFSSKAIEPEDLEDRLAALERATGKGRP